MQKAQAKKYIQPTITTAQVHEQSGKVIAVMKEARTSLDKAYAVFREWLKSVIPSELGIHDAAAKTFDRVVDTYAEDILASGFSDAKTAKSIRDTLLAKLRAEGYKRPTEKAKADEKTAKANAAKMQKSRFIKKEVAAIKAADKAAGIKRKEGEAQELAAQHYADSLLENKDRAAQEKANAKAIERIDALVREAANGDYGDGDTRELLAAFVSVQTLIKGLL